MRDGGTVYRYHTEPSGVPTRLTAPDGRFVWAADLDAFGRAQVRVAEIAQPWRLPGQYADDEFGLGLHYNRFRYYDPAIGRYISRDPVGVAGGLNLYCYVANDPINRADPLGLWWKGVVAAVAAVAVGAAIMLTAPVSIPLLLAAGALAGLHGQRGAQPRDLLPQLHSARRTEGRSGRLSETRMSTVNHACITPPTLGADQAAGRASRWRKPASATAI